MAATKPRHTRPDANQREITDALDWAGVSWLDLHEVGDGVLDILTSYQGRTVLMEIKTARGKLRAGQRTLIDTWQGETALVRTAAEALAVYGIRVAPIPMMARNIAQSGG